MFNGKYTTLSRVIENIVRDTSYDNELYIDDVREWAIRAMNLIGVNLPYEKVPDTLTVENFRSLLPDDMIELISIRNSATKKALSASTDEFLISINEDDMPVTPYIAGKHAETTVVPAYKISNGYIFFNFELGDIDIIYTRYMVDENGCIMIPDVDRYLKAIESYIIFKVDSKLYRKGLIPKDIKFESEQNWLWYVNSAANKLITPDYDVAENIYRQHMTMTPGDAHSGNFSTLNYPTVKKF